MESYKRIIELVDANLIHCLIPIILTLLFVELCFKNRFETKKILHLICWLIIVYAAITWAVTLIGMAFYPEEFAFINRATGPYKIAYWIMFLSAFIFPFTLLNKKLASKYFYVLFVVFAMKIGFYFERFAIIVTSYHRDFLTEKGSYEFTNSLTFGIGILFFQGIIMAILSLGIFEIIKLKKTVYNKSKP